MSSVGTKMMLFPLTVFILSAAVMVLLGVSGGSDLIDADWYIDVPLFGGVALLSVVATVLTATILADTEWFGIFSLGSFSALLLFKAGIILSVLAISSAFAYPLFSGGGPIGTLAFGALYLMTIIGFWFHVGGAAEGDN